MKRRDTKNAFEGDLLRVCKLSNKTMDQITKTGISPNKKPIEEKANDDDGPILSSQLTIECSKIEPKKFKMEEYQKKQVSFRGKDNSPGLKPNAHIKHNSDLDLVRD